MPDEPFLENLIIITSPYPVEYTQGYFLLKQDREKVFKQMGEPGHYARMFSLSTATKPEPPDKWAGMGVRMTRVHDRSPYQLMNMLQEVAKVKFLGRGEREIDDMIIEIEQMLRESKEIALRIKPPARL